MKANIVVTALSFVLALAAAIVLLKQDRLIEVNGQRVIVLVMFPVVVALVPVMFPARVVRIIASVLLCGFTLLASFTIGLFYLPASLLMLLAVTKAACRRLW